EAVADGGGGRLVDEGQHLHARRARAQLGRMPGQPLRVRWNRHHRLRECLVQVLLGVALEQAEEHDGDLLGAQVLPDERHALRRAEDALDRADRALLVKVLLGLLPERQAAVAAQRHDRRCPQLPLLIGHYLCLTIMKIRDNRVARAEVDTNVGHIGSSVLSWCVFLGTNGVRIYEGKAIHQGSASGPQGISNRGLRYLRTAATVKKLILSVPDHASSRRQRLPPAAWSSARGRRSRAAWGIRRPRSQRDAAKARRYTRRPAASRRRSTERTRAASARPACAARGRRGSPRRTSGTRTNAAAPPT